MTYSSSSDKIATVLRSPRLISALIRVSSQMGGVKGNGLGPLAFHLGDKTFEREYVREMLLAEKWKEVLNEITEAFCEEEVLFSWVKGGHFRYRVYPDPALRPMGDLDVVVAPVSWENAVLVLKGLGFVFAGSRAQKRWTHHAMMFRRGDSAIDLHRWIYPPQRCGLNMDVFWSNPDYFSNEWEFSKVVHHIVTAAHIARHGGDVPLMSYVDFIQTLGIRGDIEGLARDLGLFRAWEYSRGCLGELLLKEQVDGGANFSASPSKGVIGRIWQKKQVTDRWSWFGKFLWGIVRERVF